MMRNISWKHCLAILLGAWMSSEDCMVDALASGGVGTVTLESTKAGIENGAPRVETIDLGQDKLVSLFVPQDGVNQQPKQKPVKSSKKKKRSQLELARLIAHCPSFVDDLNVLELGCGLGLVSAAAAKHAAPSHVAVTDMDATVLAKAYSSCTQLNRSKASISRCVMDWSDRSTWPKQSYDVVLATDVLRRKAALPSLIDVLKFYLSDGENAKLKRALIVDPVKRLNRDSFLYAANRAGLETDAVKMTDDFVLISVTNR